MLRTSLQETFKSSLSLPCTSREGNFRKCISICCFGCWSAFTSHLQVVPIYFLPISMHGKFLVSRIFCLQPDSERIRQTATTINLDERFLPSLIHCLFSLSRRLSFELTYHPSIVTALRDQQLFLTFLENFAFCRPFLESLAFCRHFFTRLWMHLFIILIFSAAKSKLSHYFQLYQIINAPCIKYILLFGWK